MARSLRAAGGRPGHKVHNAYGYGLFTGGLGAHYGAERLGCTAIPISGGMTARQVQLIHDFRPEIIMVTPSYMLTIVDEFEKQGARPGGQLAAGRHVRRRAVDRARCAPRSRSAWTSHAVDIYGLSEVMGPGRGAGVRGDQGRPAHLGGPLLPGGRRPARRRACCATARRASCVFTSLTKEALPIIRYRTRDLTRLLPGTARPGMRRMEKITGRTDDMIILRGVNVFPTQIEEIVLRTAGLSPHFQLVLTTPRPDGRADRAGGGPPRTAPPTAAAGRRRGGRGGEADRRGERRRARSSTRRPWSARWASSSGYGPERQGVPSQRTPAARTERPAGANR